MQREFFFIAGPYSIYVHTHIYIYRRIDSESRVRTVTRNSIWGGGWLAQRCRMKFSKATIQPSHRVTNRVSTPWLVPCRGVDIPGDVASIGSAEPRLIGPTGLKGISKTLRTSLFSPFFQRCFSRNKHETYVWIFFFFFFSRNEEKRESNDGGLLCIGKVCYGYRRWTQSAYLARIYLIWWRSM